MKFKAPVGPFTTRDGKIIKDSECKTLNSLYHSVFDDPDNDCEITEEYIYFELDLPPIDKTIETVIFTIGDIKKTVALIHSEYPGPSGTCPILVQKTINTIAGLLLLMYNKILEEKQCPR